MATIGNTNGLNFTGLATGINTTNIIDGLTRINNRRIDALKSKQSDFADKQSAFAALQGRLFELQSKAGTLARSVSGAFDGKSAVSSDAARLTVAAGASAQTGDYSVTVNALAQAQQTVSAGFADPNAVLKQGTLSIKVGAGTAVTVTLDARNNTLQGLADAVNAAGGDVKASIINDGSASPYRLMFTSTKTGAANTIAVTNNLSGGTGADIDPLATTIRTASDASVSLGSGANAITVTSATNQISGVIPGLSLNVLQADPTKPLTVTIANDTSAATNAVKSLVDSFNGVVDFIDQVAGYDATTKKAGMLLGNHDLAGLKDALASAMSANIPGLSASANRLSSVGISFDDKSRLALDESKLRQALSGQTGATTAEIKKLFGTSGRSDNPGLAFVLASDKTKPSGPVPYQVQVTTPAARAVVVASGPPASSITVIPANATLQLKLNGLAAQGIDLPVGSFDVDQLASMLQSRINAVPAFKDNLVTVGVDAGKLSITTLQYGASASVAVTGGTAMADLGFAGTETATGTDVAGRFIVNGDVETATGSGQVLTGSTTNANTPGLQVRSTLTAAGSGSLSVSHGIASRLAQVLSNFLDPSKGKLKTINEGYQRNIDSLAKSITRQSDVLATKTAELQQQFANMETAVNNFKGLQTQLASLVIPTSSN